MKLRDTTRQSSKSIMSLTEKWAVTRGRYDIGDGDGSLIDHISTYQTDFLDNEKWDAYIKERDGEEALATDKKQRKQLVYKFIPYLNLHVALSEIEAQANKRLERSANLPMASMHTTTLLLLSYVVNSRASINNGNLITQKHLILPITTKS